MIWLENVANACELVPPAQDMAGYVWVLRARDCGVWANAFWESRLETKAEYWGL